MLGLSTLPAKAEFIATVEQVGSNVVVTGSGTIDTAGLTSAGASVYGSAIAPSQGLISIGSPNGEGVSLFTGITGPTTFGGGGFVAPSDSGSGDKVTLYDALDQLALPVGYVSGSALSDTSTYDNTTLANLGVTPGTYTYTFGSGATADTFIINAGAQAPAAVPEPASLAVLPMAIGLTLLASRGRRKAKETGGDPFP
jgi:hypothetical protein